MTSGTPLQGYFCTCETHEFNITTVYHLNTSDDVLNRDGRTRTSFYIKTSHSPFDHEIALICIQDTAILLGLTLVFKWFSEIFTDPLVLGRMFNFRTSREVGRLEEDQVMDSVLKVRIEWLNLNSSLFPNQSRRIS
eukprot:TRINITY_DN1033_c0_g2_i14.p1 TRINITY_DN1033_c0_g2~~TRINITY_DN1033_c0_g2_i14.p1  ORF type:complete len:136 (-),score=11.41 TRINITY_DN1033_c0_g2_i14:135-542(-)